VPSSIDWRDYGYVTEVGNQESCGSCWAFSTVGVVEGQHKNSTGTLVTLSEQQLVDCDGSDYACMGGSQNTAMRYLISAGSISEADYPYTGARGICQAKGKPITATISTYTDLPFGNEETLMEATASVGPISIAIDASNYSFQLYSGGVYYEPRCSSYHLDHAMLLVGYGNSNGYDMWQVKNSWGTEWGMDGYVMMARNRHNNCGIASSAVYALT